jgi:hypothetical protein
MSSHEKALERKEKHKCREGEDGKCKICNMIMSHDGKLNEKGRKPKKEFGAKNNDSEED